MQIISDYPKIIKAYPPNYKDIRTAFPWIVGRPGIVYAFGDRIYNPTGGILPPYVLAHEGVHCKRQMAIPCHAHLPLEGILAWWKSYIASEKYRLEEEVLAHRIEWNEYRSNHNFKENAQYLEMMCDRLSGKLYGHMCSREKARELITELGA